MKSVLLFGLLTLANVANAQDFALDCTTDTGKRVVVVISDDGRRNYLDQLVVDGLNFTNGAWMSVTRGSGIQIAIDKYRDGQRLSMSLMGPYGSTYQIANGTVRQMNCTNNAPSARPNDGI
ncbi:hypothetical protein D3C87_1070000 [compost metagenome]